MIILKPYKNKPIYVQWSMIADGPGLVAYSEEEALLLFIDATARRLMRADVHGTSAMSYDTGEPGSGNWSDAGLIAAQRWLPRENLLAYAEAYLARDRARLEELTEEIVG